MDDRDLEHSSAAWLAEVFALAAEDSPFWRPDDLEALWRHQLAAPLEFDFSYLNEALRGRMQALSSAGAGRPRTFAELFHDPHPAVELLELTKEFAKACRNRPEAPLPEEIAALLYTVSIVAALSKCGCRITEWDDQQLREQLDWALAQPWLDAATRELLRAGYTVLDAQTVAAPASALDQRPPDVSAAGPLLQPIGEYRLLEKLGEGGMGTVYKAWQGGLGRPVALKVLRPDTMHDESTIARFRREMKAVGRLDHPNLVRAFDARQIDQVHVLVMEYVDGMDLDALGRRCGPLPPAEACELIRQAAVGLQYAHQQGLVHRDVKPSNLMLSRSGQVKVLDLGLARVRAAGASALAMTAVGQVMGTPDYIAPEQVSDSHTVDIRADIYSLGCTLYRLLAGQAPFGGPEYRSAWDKMMAHAEQPVPPIAQFRSDLPPPLVGVLERMLAKNPGDRFATPGEVAAALAPLTHGADLLWLAAQAEGRTFPHPGPLPKGEGEDTHPGPLPKAETEDTHPGLLPGKDSGTLPDAPLAGDATKRPIARWRRPWVVVGGLLMLALVVGLGALLVIGPRHGGSPDETDGARPRPPADDGGGRAAVPPDPRELPGWIVLSWTRLRLGRPNLWLFSPDGKRRIPLTDDRAAYHIHPKFSPDGRQIAFIRGEGPTDPNGVWVCHSDGTEQRQLVAARDKFERFASPVWVSNSRLYYARDRKLDRAAEMEIWRVDLDGTPPRLVFRFRDALGERSGIVTDVSPDGRQLAVIAQTEALWPTADVYVTDLSGGQVQTIWADQPDEFKDARALWSPDGKRLAWHHNFSRGTDEKAMRCGVGLAWQQPEGKWTTRLQPEPNAVVTPLAWCPRGNWLLCAQIHDAGRLFPPATVFLMDEQFQSVRVLFELQASTWVPIPRDVARLADWAIIPEDVPLPKPQN